MTEQTYTATITMESVGDSNDVQVRVSWSPHMTGAQVQELGFLPASFNFVQEFILPALEAAMLEDLDASETTTH